MSQESKRILKAKIKLVSFDYKEKLRRKLQHKIKKLMPQLPPPSSKFPQLPHSRPDWPNQDDDHLFWVGLNTEFRYAHHPALNEDKPSEHLNFICPPTKHVEQILSVLKDSDGGSILVTGYRGTGKTSLVNSCLKKIHEDVNFYTNGSSGLFHSVKPKMVEVRVNMATVSSAQDVLLLTYEALIHKLELAILEHKKNVQDATTKTEVINTQKIQDREGINKQCKTISKYYKDELKIAKESEIILSNFSLANPDLGVIKKKCDDITDTTREIRKKFDFSVDKHSGDYVNSIDKSIGCVKLYTEGIGKSLENIANRIGNSTRCICYKINTTANILSEASEAAFKIFDEDLKCFGDDLDDVNKIFNSIDYSVNEKAKDSLKKAKDSLDLIVKYLDETQKKLDNFRSEKYLSIIECIDMHFNRIKKTVNYIANHNTSQRKGQVNSFLINSINSVNSNVLRFIREVAFQKKVIFDTTRNNRLLLRNKLAKFCEKHKIHHDNKRPSKGLKNIFFYLCNKKHKIHQSNLEPENTFLLIKLITECITNFQKKHEYYVKYVNDLNSAKDSVLEIFLENVANNKDYELLDWLRVGIVRLNIDGWDEKDNAQNGNNILDFKLINEIINDHESMEFLRTFSANIAYYKALKFLKTNSNLDMVAIEETVNLINFFNNENKIDQLIKNRDLDSISAENQYICILKACLLIKQNGSPLGKDSGCLNSQDKESNTNETAFYIEREINELKKEAKQLRASRMTEHQTPKVGIDPFFGASDHQEHLEFGTSKDQVFEREALTRFQAKFISKIKGLKQKANLRIIFIFDEVDKLAPSDNEDMDNSEIGSKNSKNADENKLKSLQQIVAELKSFLSESSSHQIFIAGKDVDDSWAEDQNKGEGIFESIFACNVYLSSIFSLDLDPCEAVLPADLNDEEVRQFYSYLAKEIGIPENSIVFRTALLILPHLAQYELVQLMLRINNKEPAAPLHIRNKIRRWLHNYRYGNARHDAKADFWPHKTLTYDWTEIKRELAEIDTKNFDKFKPHVFEHKTETLFVNSKYAKLYNLNPMSERTCRRLRTLFQYLTYKGRGIPRKIMREFYGMVAPSSRVPQGDPGIRKLCLNSINDTEVKYVLALPQHHLQKMNFYASIVEYLDQNFSLLRGLNDKGKVSIFHILDYVLKFYATGFSYKDIEHANFMTSREELFPSRQLAGLILRIMNGRLWRKKDSRSSEFRMVHQVTHDLGVMFLRYGPEQTELRHTINDFRAELPKLHFTLSGINGISAEQRLAPIHAQMRMGRIKELSGHHFEARLAYYVALRWLRQDLSHYEKMKEQKVNRQTGNKHPLLTDSFPIAFATYTVETHLALGRLLEEVLEVRSALQHYEEAALFCEKCMDFKCLSNAVIDKATTININNLFGLSELGITPEQLSKTLVSGDTELQFFGQKTTNINLMLKQIIYRQPPMRSLKTQGIPLGYVDVCNHGAIASSKLWERNSAGLLLLKALFYLDFVGDEYALIDQMFFIGQLMVRHRDFRAAAQWYLIALVKIQMIKSHSANAPIDEGGPTLQSGTNWQTPTANSITEAQILASLGDITFATRGYAFLPLNYFNDQQVNHTILSQNSVSKKIKEIVTIIVKKILHTPVTEDRLDEYFHTCARQLLETSGQDVDAKDVYLRQLEARLDMFEQSISRIDEVNANVPIGEYIIDVEYTRFCNENTPYQFDGNDKNISCEKNEATYLTLNSWTGFWRGARILIHRHMSTITPLTRNLEGEWGKVSDLRRLGTTLRLMGEMFKEIGFRKIDSPSRQLLTSISNQLSSLPGFEPNKFFYKTFFGNEENVYCNLSQIQSELWSRCELLNFKKSHRVDIFKAHRRIDVNRAFEDISVIFSYLCDKLELSKTNSSDTSSDDRSRLYFGGSSDPRAHSFGLRSPLFRVNGNFQSSRLCLGYILDEVRNIYKYNEKKIDQSMFRLGLLAMSEVSLISGYLCYRDCVPDYSYAQLCLSVGELYVGALYQLAGFVNELICDYHDDHYSVDGFCVSCDKELIMQNPLVKLITESIDVLTENAKRFLVKSIDILKREQEQNRNTFNLMSEAWLNLGDVTMIRLMCCDFECNGEFLRGNLFGPFFTKLTREYFNKIQHASNVPHRKMDDTCPEDLRRQVWEAYQQGLSYVQNEMNDFRSRYRIPSDVYYAHRNFMDSTLHFRICRAARLRHSGGRPDLKEDSFEFGFDENAFNAEWQKISDQVAAYESPHHLTKHWALSVSNLIRSVNSVRSDRGPLQVKINETNNFGPGASPEALVEIRWLEHDKIVLPAYRRRFVFFSHFSRKNASKNNDLRPPYATSPQA